MPAYEYRCQKCREVFEIERSMSDNTEPSCSSCGHADVSRIFGAFIRSGGSTPDVGQGTAAVSRKSSGGCGSCCSTSCGSCH
ncbi:MAG TPA: zinc ribbon domain-containing protein [Planktothrix sp.]